MPARARGSYQPVEQDVDVPEDKTIRPLHSSRAEYVSTKLHALLWVGSAGLLIYALDMYHVFFYDKRVQRTYFDFGMVCMGINTLITFYLAIWLPRVQQIHLEWSVYCPRMIPTATAVGVCGTLALLRGLWPVWGFLTPGIFFVLFVGGLMTAHFLPAI